MNAMQNRRKFLKTMLAGPAVTMIQSRNVTLLGGTYPVTKEAFLKDIGKKSEYIRFSGDDFNSSIQTIELRPGVQKDTVRIERE
jgi:hypothetical protein